MELKDLKSEGLGLIKTLSAIIASLGVVWSYTEPVVEDYVHEQVILVQEEDKRLIDSLDAKLFRLRSIVDNDYNTAKSGRNIIIEEIQYFYPGTRLKTEK